MRSLSFRLVLSAAACAAIVPAQALDIVLNPDAGLSANSAALAAFNRAAAQWESAFSDAITVNINAGLADLGNNSTIGQASTAFVQTDYTTGRAALIADAADEPSNAIVSSLPTTFSANTPGAAFSGNLFVTRANAKALGVALSSGVDSTITFNTRFNFNYSTSAPNGGQTDFETVALHEIGHALGFVSIVDSIGSSGSYVPTTLDLFRFNNSNLPTTAALFATTARELRPGQESSFSDTQNAYRFSTGTATSGDGRQASHWKDDALTGTTIGIMDPTLARNVRFSYTDADLRAFDLMGWDLAQPVPEPGTWAALGFAALAVLRRRKRA